MASQVAEIVYLFNCRSISDRFLVASQLLLAVISVPFPQIDTIEAMVIVWRVRGKIIRSVLCNIVCNNCAQCNAHTYMNRL